MSDLSETIRPHVAAIESSASHGNKKALMIISLYQMHVKCPNDPGAAGLCQAAFDDWMKSQRSKSDASA